VSAVRRRPALTGSYTPVLLTLAALTGLALASLPVGFLLPALLATFVVLPAFLTPQAALLPLLILAPLRALIATEAPLQLPLDIGQLGLLVWLVAWAARHVARYQRLPQVVWTPLYLPFLAFLMVTGLSVFSSGSPGAWSREWLKWLAMLTMIALVASSMQGNAWRWPLRGVLLAGAANAVVGLYQFLGGSGALHLLVNGRYFRAFGTFGQPNPFGGFMAMLAPLALCLTLASLWRCRRACNPVALAALGGYAATGALLLAGLLASWSRGAWLAFAAAALVMLLALPRRLLHGALLAAGTLLLVALMWSAGVLPASLSARLASAATDYLVLEDMRGAAVSPANYPVVERLAHWQAALNMATANPWLGVGLGNYEAVYEHYRLINWPMALGHAHNFWLNLLAETGVAGLLCYTGIWLSVLLCLWRARSHPDPGARLVIVGLLGTWTSLSVHHLFDNLLVNNLFLHIGVLLGVLAVLHRQARSFPSFPVAAPAFRA